MSVEIEAYENEHGDPVVVMVVKGTFDVSRLIYLQNYGRCEDVEHAIKATRQLKRHNAGRRALQLLSMHSSPADAEKFDAFVAGVPVTEAASS